MKLFVYLLILVWCRLTDLHSNGDQNLSNQLSVPNTFGINNFNGLNINQSSPNPGMVHPNMVSIIVENVPQYMLHSLCFFVNLIHDHILCQNIWSCCMQVQVTPAIETYASGVFATPQRPAFFPLQNHISNSHSAWSSRCFFAFFYFHLTLTQLSLPLEIMNPTRQQNYASHMWTPPLVHCQTHNFVSSLIVF